MNLIRCNECTEEKTEETAIRWLELRIFGPDSRAFGHWSMDLPAHFCSLKCLTDWSTEMLRHVTKPV